MGITRELLKEVSVYWLLAGAGCISSNLVRALLRADVEKIVVLDDLSAFSSGTFQMILKQSSLEVAFWMRSVLYSINAQICLN